MEKSIVRQFRFSRHILMTVCLAIWAMLLAPQTVHAADKLTICYVATHSALVPLANLRGFYAAERIDVEVRSFPSGRHTLAAMFAGECALAAAGETPTVHSSLSRNDFRILATISVSGNIERMIVRNDRGIRTAADLRGRRIAVPQFTSAHNFLDAYLAANGLAPQDVIKVYLPAQEIAQAFRSGDVDAVAHWEPNIEVLAREFGSKAKVFTAPGLYSNSILLLVGRDFLHQNPATVERVLRALLRAERFVKEQPTEGKALMARQYNLSASDADLIWPLHDFSVSLDQSLLFILESTARWEIGLMPPEQRPAPPNYLDFIYLDGLKTVKPEAVTIIH
ncbi:MAG: NrtA/SsuA/CpmA family ABC transporter substrate-binding protein [Gallionella sp.]|nr:NrtA/SsuA/CpmA family ABC transporter substrate-binding protein [Gallionella sp.]